MIQRMGKQRRINKHLPKRVYKKGPSYYYVTPQNQWIWLAKTEPAMLRALAALAEERPGGLNDVIADYRVRVLPKKAIGTQTMQARQLDTIARVFGHMAPRHIRPVHIARFHDKRGAKAPITANRELALLSHLMRWAIRTGHCETNPCATIQRHPEKPRDRYVTDAEYNAVWTIAPAHIRVLMDLAYLTGQRQGDLIRLRRSDLDDAGIHFRQAKTGRGLIVEWSPKLRAVIDAARALSSVASVYVVCTRSGQGYSSSGIQTAWQRLMRKAVEQHIVADKFTFHDLRGKAGTDADDGRLLGHMSNTMLERVYRRKPQSFKPVH